MTFHLQHAADPPGVSVRRRAQKDIGRRHVRREVGGEADLLHIIHQALIWSLAHPVARPACCMTLVDTHPFFNPNFEDVFVAGADG